MPRTRAAFLEYETVARSNEQFASDSHRCKAVIAEWSAKTIAQRKAIAEAIRNVEKARERGDECLRTAAAAGEAVTHARGTGDQTLLDAQETSLAETHTLREALTSLQIKLRALLRIHRAQQGNGTSETYTSDAWENLEQTILETTRDVHDCQDAIARTRMRIGGLDVTPSVSSGSSEDSLRVGSPERHEGPGRYPVAGPPPPPRKVFEGGHLRDESFPPIVEAHLEQAKGNVGLDGERWVGAWMLQDGSVSKTTLWLRLNTANVVEEVI